MNRATTITTVPSESVFEDIVEAEGLREAALVYSMKPIISKKQQQQPLQECGKAQGDTQNS